MIARHQHQRTIARDPDATLHNVLQPITKKKKLQMLAQTSKHCCTNVWDPTFTHMLTFMPKLGRGTNIKKNVCAKPSSI